MGDLAIIFWWGVLFVVAGLILGFGTVIGLIIMVVLLVLLLREFE